jgi:hypothetical protein
MLLSETPHRLVINKADERRPFLIERCHFFRTATCEQDSLFSVIIDKKEGGYMALRVAINGFGRIEGIFRTSWAHKA